MGEIRKGLYKLNASVWIPERARNFEKDVIRAWRRLTIELCRWPTDEEVRKTLKVEKRKWRGRVEFPSSTISLSTPTAYEDVDDDGSLEYQPVQVDMTLADDVPHTDRAASDEQLAYVRKALRHLEPRERTVVGMRLGLDRDPLKTEAVARLLGITPNNVSQIYRRAEEKLSVLVRLIQ